ncbi:MAG: hypothetical protein V1685_03420 [Parcubacteria group bacterium]
MKIKKTRRLWGIRAGKGGEAHKQFLDRSVIALADAKLSDLSKIEPTRESFYSAYRKLHPDETRTGSAGIAGKFFRFTHEVVKGDFIVYPALSEKLVYVAEVTGKYMYVKTSEFPHQRTVKWKYVIPKKELSQSARYELGAARTFFEFKKNREELMAKMSDDYLFVKEI